MIVYVVTTNPHGDRIVKAVFEDRDRAVYFCALHEHEDSELDEMDTEAIQITGNKKPLHEWTVFVKPDGVVSEMSKRYTFNEVLWHEVDLDGTVLVRMTLDMDIPEGKVKEIAIDYVRQLKK